MNAQMIFGLLLLGGASGAVAQIPAPAPVPAGQPLGGAVVPGICLLSREAIFANAAIGKAATARLQELARVAQAEIDSERQPIETEAKALDGQPDNAHCTAARSCPHGAISVDCR